MVGPDKYLKLPPGYAVAVYIAGKNMRKPPYLVQEMTA